MDELIPDNLEDRMREEVALTPQTKTLWQSREKRIHDQLMKEDMFWAVKKANVIDLKRYRRNV